MRAVLIFSLLFFSLDALAADVVSSTVAADPRPTEVGIGLLSWALRNGEVLVFVGGLIASVLMVARALKFDAKSIDGTPGVIVAAVLTLLSGLSGALLDGQGLVSAIGAALEMSIPVLLALIVPSRKPDAES